MRNVITLNKNRQDAEAAETKTTGITRISPLDKPYSSEREAGQHREWNLSASSVQPVEEDMNDPDLARSYSGNCSYMLQPG